MEWKASAAASRRDFSGPHLVVDCHIWHRAILNMDTVQPIGRPARHRPPGPLHFRFYYFYLRNKLKNKSSILIRISATEIIAVPGLRTDVSGYCRDSTHPSRSKREGRRSVQARRLAVEARGERSTRSQLRSERPTRQSRPRSISRFAIQSPFEVRTARCEARVRTGYCGVLWGYDGRAGRSTRAPLRVAVRDGFAGRGVRHVRRSSAGPAAQRPRRNPAPGYAAMPRYSSQRSQATLRPVLWWAAFSEPWLGALPHARHSGWWLRFLAAQKVSTIEREED